MPIFRKLDDYFRYINSRVIQAMDAVGETALQEMRNLVEEGLNNDSDNKLYRQTGEYLNSIQRLSAKLRVDGVIETKIYYNTDNISVYIQGENPPFHSEQNWNWHADIKGNDIRELLPYWLDVTGTHGKSFYDREPIGALKYMNEEWVTKYFRNELKKELNKLGVPAK